MSNYIETLPEQIKEYFHVLSPEIPEFIYEYIEAPEMQRLAGISITPGTDYTNIFKNLMFYSRLVHSIGVSLIVWNFTKDKKQALAGLFHDIANPAFSHCVDFLHGDYEKQESTEELTTTIIKNSEYIMSRLKRDGITLEEVEDYKLYPIADNSTPQLSADRLEYTFSNGYAFMPVWKADEVKQIYSDIEVLKNENGIAELGFKTKEIAEFFIEKIKVLWIGWIEDKDRFAMQVIADILKLMVNENLITEKEFYKYSEKGILKIAQKSGVQRIVNAVKGYENATEVFTADEPKEGVYNIKLVSKRRYINPLVKQDEVNKRLADISPKTKDIIDKYFEYDMSKYVYSNFDI